MTPEELKAVRDRLARVPCQDWEVRGDNANETYHIVRVEFPQWADAHIPDDAPGMRDTAEFIAHSRADIPALLAHADALQARLDAAEAERDQLRAIFSQDYLEDNEAARLAYERGRADLLREQKEKNEAGGYLLPPHIAKSLMKTIGENRLTVTGPTIRIPSSNEINLGAVTLPATVAVSPELLEDSTSGVTGGAGR